MIFMFKFVDDDYGNGIFIILYFINYRKRFFYKEI